MYTVKIFSGKKKVHKKNTFFIQNKSYLKLKCYSNMKTMKLKTICQMDTNYIETVHNCVEAVNQCQNV